MPKQSAYAGFPAVVADKGKRIHLVATGTLCGAEAKNPVQLKAGWAIQRWQVCRKCLAKAEIIDKVPA